MAYHIFAAGKTVGQPQGIHDIGVSPGVSLSGAIGW